MLRKVFFTVCLSIVSLTASGSTNHLLNPHAESLSPCQEACLAKDIQLHTETLKALSFEKMQASYEDCLQTDYYLHTMTLTVFAQYGRSKDYILNELGSYLEQNSLVTLGCLFSNLLDKDSETTLECLSHCSEDDFKPLK